MKLRFKLFYLTFFLTIFLFFSLTTASDEKLTLWSINMGGGIHSDLSSYKIYGSIGQPVAIQYTGDYHIYAGFWNPWTKATLDIIDQEQKIFTPEKFTLSQNYPNPFNLCTIIEYTLPKKGQVSITIYNILGQKVRLLSDEIQERGGGRVIWDGRDDKGSEVASGFYFYRIQIEDLNQCRKMLLLK